MKFFFLLISVQIVFNSYFIAVGLRAMFFYSIPISFLVLLFFLLSRKHLNIPSSILSCIIFMFYGLLLLIYYLSLNPSNVFIPIIGFVGTFFFIIYWILTLMLFEKNEIADFSHFVMKSYLFFGIITAILTIYQYHIDQSLFGFNRHQHYSDLVLIERGTITQRATGLIGSPQVLGLFLYLVFALTIFWPIKKYKSIFLALIGYAGLLSGSSIFGGSTLMFLLSRWVIEKGFITSKRDYFPILLLLILLPVGLVITFSFSFMQEALFSSLNFNITGHLPFYLTFLEGQNISIFGKGLGYSDRLIEVFFNFRPPIGWKSNESYILKIIYEFGILGVILFSTFLISILFKSYKIKNELGLFYYSLSIGFILNIIFTPALTGLTASYIVWFFLIFPFFIETETMEIIIKNKKHFAISNIANK